MQGFHIELEMKDKMIDAFICYGEDKWNLELSSGMERFVSSLNKNRINQCINITSSKLHYSR